MAERKGIAGIGAFIMDHVRMIDMWPEEQTLAELLPQVTACARDVELVVVANDTSDRTLEICRRAGVDCVEEPRRGLSVARNTAVKVTQGDAMALASKAGALMVTRHGTADVIPAIQEVEAFRP